MVPSLKSDCGRLGLPSDYISGIYRHRKCGESCCCEITKKDGEKKANLRVGYDSGLFMSMVNYYTCIKYAEQEFKGKPISHVEADLYGLTRGIGFMLKRAGRTMAAFLSGHQSQDERSITQKQAAC